MSGSSTQRAVKLAAVLAVVALLVLAQQLGIFRRFADPAGVRAALVQLGPWGWLAYVAAYASLQPFGFSAMVFYFGAPLIWPWPVAFALSLAGAMGASVVGFVFARFVARDWVAARVPPRLRRHDEALARRGFTTVFLLRLVFWMSSPLHAFFGVSRVGFWTHFWASLLAYVPPMLLVSLFGERLFELVLAAPRELWLAVGVGLVALGLGVWALRRRRGGARRGRRGVAAPRRAGQGPRADPACGLGGGSGRAGGRAGRSIAPRSRGSA